MECAEQWESANISGLQSEVQCLVNAGHTDTHPEQPINSLRQDLT